jgi:hypothetical protein
MKARYALFLNSNKAVPVAVPTSAAAPAPAVSLTPPLTPTIPPPPLSKSQQGKVSGGAKNKNVSFSPTEKDIERLQTRLDEEIQKAADLKKSAKEEVFYSSHSILYLSAFLLGEEKRR